MPGIEGVDSCLESGRAVDVMLVDSRAVVREGLRAEIEQAPDLVVVAQAATVYDAGSLDIAPDVIITDVALPDAKCSHVISGLREFFPQSPILVFTSIRDPAEVQAVLNAGASGYLLETAEGTELLAAIRAVAAGSSYVQPSLGVELARAPRPPDPAAGLSPQEERVLRLLVLGHTNSDIAQLCNISLRTAEAHRAHIQRRLGLHTRAELVQYARENGFIHLGPQ
jgi:two-component system, NarL family, response regulator NreC